jgi:DNA-binding response OmpR family regulator
LTRERPDLVILDIALPDANGLDILKEIRRYYSVPVLVVSVRSDELSRVKGLELGADDYMSKPFSHTELLARIRAVLRRSHMPELWGDEGVVQGKGLAIDLASGRTYVEGREVELTATEWDLLSYLVRNEGRIVPVRVLAEKVWGLEFVENSTIRMSVHRLRTKLGDDTKSPRIIRSHRGRGYGFALPR